jgi:hypothetical protein
VAVGQRKRQDFGLGAFADENRAVLIEVRHSTIPCR